MEPYGCLVYYLDNKDRHPLFSATKPGPFLGWEIESGMRYRGVLIIADYDNFRQGSFQRILCKAIPHKECAFPDVTEFPFANAKRAAIKT